MALIGVRASGDTAAVAHAMAGLDEVEYLVLTAGSFDLVCEVVVDDDKHLLAVLNDRVRAIPGVASTETFVYLRLCKQTYTWGARERSGRPS